MTKIFIIAGEDSGDQLGAALIPALQKIFPDMELRGIGGPAMLEAGLPESLFPMHKLSVMGIAEILPRIPEFSRLIAQTVQAAAVFDPDFIVSIDAPDFSFRVQKQLKKKNIRAKKIHYVAPTVWAWRAGRAQKVAQFL
ncbi:MAG: lipid-A-disaccharide synthase, partial [Pseudomonadota bacterium]